MPEAQRRARRGVIGRGGAVGILDEVPEQVGLHVIDAALCERRLGRVGVPIGVVIAPHAVDVVGTEDVVQVHILELVVTLHVADHLHQVEHHGAGIIDAVTREFLVIEQFFQHALGVEPLIEAFFAFLGHGSPQFSGYTVAVVHVVHGRLAGIGGDFQPRIERGEHIDLVLHRQDAADDHSRAGYHGSAVLEHLREVLEHAAGDALVLLGADVAELAQTALAGLMHLPQHVEHFLAAAGEFAVAFALLEHLQGIGVFFLLNEPATAVTAVVVDEKRLVAVRRRRQGWKSRRGVGLVVVGAQFGVCLEILAHTGIGDSQHRQHDDKDTDESSHISVLIYGLIPQR